MTRRLRDFAGREAGQQEQHHHHNQYHNHVLVRLKGIFQHQHFKVVDLFRVHPSHLFFQTLAFREDQIFAQQNTGSCANGVKGLADVQA